MIRYANLYCSHEKLLYDVQEQHTRIKSSLNNNKLLHNITDKNDMGIILIGYTSMHSANINRLYEHIIKQILSVA